VRGEHARFKDAFEGLNAGKVEAERRISAALGEKGVVQAHFEETNAEKERLQVHVQQLGAENAALRSRLAGVETIVREYQDEASHMHERAQRLQQEKDQLEDQMLQRQPAPGAPAGMPPMGQHYSSAPTRMPHSGTAL